MCAEETVSRIILQRPPYFMKTMAISQGFGVGIGFGQQYFRLWGDSLRYLLESEVLLRVWGNLQSLWYFPESEVLFRV